MMSPSFLLSAISNPKTQAAAFLLLESAAATFRLIAKLDKPEMSDQEKADAWSEIKAMNAQADQLLHAAITNHPAWKDDKDQSL